MNEQNEREVDWLETKERELVEVAVFDLGHKAIHEALRSIAKNFSPDECADIIQNAFKKIVDDPKLRENVTTWVRLENERNSPTAS